MSSYIAKTKNKSQSRNLNKFSSFIFESYKLDQTKKIASFNYSFDNKLKFTETIDFSSRKIDFKKVNEKLLDNILFNLHLAIGIGYYKAYCPKKIIIHSGSLNKEQAEFWNNIYLKGLGEFFYRNKIDFRGLINFPYKNKEIGAIKVSLRNRVISPLGGGKDSCLAAEKLRELDYEFSLFSLRTSQIQKETAKVIKAPYFFYDRRIDPLLFKLNSEGAYNGHVPISNIYIFISLLAAVLENYDTLAFANEQSSNFGNVKYLGLEINHQYSKSGEFEKLISDYIKNFINPDLKFFSLLRPYSELKIVEEFSKYPKYFPVFSSCNRNFSITKKSKQKWCGECPKCAFTFALMAAYNPLEKVIKIFQTNLFADQKLLPLFQELWGEKRFKPFDCVGTPSEVRAAFLLALKQEPVKKTFIGNYFNAKIKTKIKNPETLIRENLEDSLNNYLPFEFKKILILGFGRDGSFVFKYLRERYPDIHLWIADQNKINLDKSKTKNTTLISGSNYLKNLKDFNLIIKSQGISDQIKELKEARENGVEITSLTNIFFEKCPGMIIGVTGTKGKSTTASLIYSVLKAGGKKVQLVGNIGIDSLQYLNRATKDDIFVYELSSYQLSILEKSPQIAVFINLFPDHLPYHNGLANYAAAKANITLKQEAKDYFIYNNEFPYIKALAKKTKAKALSYNYSYIIKEGAIYKKNAKIIAIKDITLPGEHNLKNIMAALKVAELFKIAKTDIQKALKNFKALQHRLENIGAYKEITFFDDAISTTPESTLVAIEYVKKSLETIFLGGENRGYKFDVLVKKLKDLKIKNIVLFPDSGKQIKESLLKIYGKNKLPNILETKDMASAVAFAYKNTAPGKICLLSTASPSYSIFKNFEEKGDLFKAAVKKLAK